MSLWKFIRSKLRAAVCAPMLLTGPMVLPACDDPAPLIVSAPEVSERQVEGGREVTVAADIHDAARERTVRRVATVFISDNPGARSTGMDVVAETTNSDGQKVSYQHNVAMRKMLLQVSGGRDVEVMERPDGNVLYKGNIYAKTDESYQTIAQDANVDLGPIDADSITILHVADGVVSEEMGVRAVVLPFLGPILTAIAQAAGAIYEVIKEMEMNKPPPSQGAA